MNAVMTPRNDHAYRLRAGRFRCSIAMADMAVEIHG
jgi:hypothetical protein